MVCLPLESHTANLGMISFREPNVIFSVCLYVLHVSAWTKVRELVGLLCSYINFIIYLRVLLPLNFLVSIHSSCHPCI